MPAVSWRPIAGCSFASAGCAHCTALPDAGAELVREGAAGRVWTGATRLDEDRLGEPHALAEPSAVYVCDHGDLFHAATPRVWIDQVFAAMEAEPRHRFLVLTKRAERMNHYIRTRYGVARAPAHVGFGVSAERQAELDDRLPWLLFADAVRYLTLYPLLGPIDLGRFANRLAFVQAGEEPQRPADPAWFADIEAQCAAAGVPFQRSSVLVAG